MMKTLISLLFWSTEICQIAKYLLTGVSVMCNCLVQMFLGLPLMINYTVNKATQAMESWEKKCLSQFPNSALVFPQICECMFI